MLQYEQALWNKACLTVAGVDEVGRGPLAGPVVAAAVVFDPDYARRECNGCLLGLTDSKQLTAERRCAFAAILRAAPASDVAIGLGQADREEIDRLNILRATHLAMLRAVEALPCRPVHILVDGLAVGGLPCASTPIVKGDTLSLSIAAASVVAKVFRDALMCDLDARYPQYGFARHKGYGSQFHVRALLEHGPCPEHRRSFAPVREADAIHLRRQGELFASEREHRD